jgi:dolichol-phosphate mannosyltransferase
MSERIWVVIPTFNEADNLEPIIRAVIAELDREVPDAYRVLIVDDSSPDGTGKMADNLVAELPQLEVLHRSTKSGLGQAYIAGFTRALAGGAELIVEMDADFSHDPKHLASLLRAAEEADVVLGSRYVPGGGVVNWSKTRQLISRGGGAYARRILGIDVQDVTGGFKCIHRKVLEAIDLPSLRADGYVFQIEVTYRALQAGFTVKEVPITFADRAVGDSKMSWNIALEAMWLVPQLRRGTVPTAKPAPAPAMPTAAATPTADATAEPASQAPGHSPV